jgi:glycosyltransferase involved in cell wall biosynthesis
MPYYEQGEYVLDAVRSVEGQAYGNVEIILVDDCSPDNPAADLLLWRGMPNLTVIRHDHNRGAAAARNTAVASSRGEFILPLDADDLLSPHYLELTVPVLVCDPELGGVYTNVQRVGDNLRPEDILWSPNCVLPDHLSGGGPNTFLYRRAVFDSVGGYKEHLRFAEDFDFWVSALETGWHFHHLEELLFFRRVHPGGKSNRKNWVDVMANLLREHGPLCRQFADDLVAGEIIKYHDYVQAYTDLYRQYQDLVRLWESYQQTYEAYMKGGAAGRLDTVPGYAHAPAALKVE